MLHNFGNLQVTGSGELQIRFVVQIYQQRNKKGTCIKQAPCSIIYLERQSEKSDALSMDYLLKEIASTLGGDAISFCCLCMSEQQKSRALNHEE